MGLKKILPIILFFVLLPLVSAQEMAVGVYGTCHDFNVRISTRNFEPGCYDVKIDVDTPSGKGEVYDPNKGWKSSYYYINGDYCVEGNATKTYKIRTNSDEDFKVLVKLRLNTTTLISDYYNIHQNCPGEKEMPPEYFFLVVLLTILIILIGVVVYVKNPEKKKSKKKPR